MNVDDLLLLLHHHWALSTDYYTIERERVQLALIILFMACTTARPSTLVKAVATMAQTIASNIRTLRYSRSRIQATLAVMFS